MAFRKNTSPDAPVFAKAQEIEKKLVIVPKIEPENFVKLIKNQKDIAIWQETCYNTFAGEENVYTAEKVFSRQNVYGGANGKEVYHF